MIPLLVFLFIRPGEMRRSIVLPLQIFAALWYLLLAAILTIMFFELWRNDSGMARLLCRSRHWVSSVPRCPVEGVFAPF
jgi:hypothetical protein